MGDRAVVEIVPDYRNELGDQPDSLFIYSHWHGAELYELFDELLRTCPSDVLGDDIYFPRVLLDAISKEYKEYPYKGVGILVGANGGPDHDWPTIRWCRLWNNGRFRGRRMEIEYREETYQVDEWLENKPYKKERNSNGNN